MLSQVASMKKPHVPIQSVQSCVFFLKKRQLFLILSAELKCKQTWPILSHNFIVAYSAMSFARLNSLDTNL